MCCSPEMKIDSTVSSEKNSLFLFHQGIRRGPSNVTVRREKRRQDCVRFSHYFFFLRTPIDAMSEFFSSLFSAVRNVLDTAPPTQQQPAAAIAAAPGAAGPPEPAATGWPTAGAAGAADPAMSGGGWPSAPSQGAWPMASSGRDNWSWGSQGCGAASVDQFDGQRFVFGGKVIAEDSTVMDIQGVPTRVSFDSFVRSRFSGRGAHATVNKVVHQDTGTVMAAKEFELLEGDCSEKIVSELQALKQCTKNANIVNYYGVLYAKDTVFIFVEYMDRGSIEDAIKKSASPRVPEPIVAHMMSSVLRALAFLSSLHVMHRDVKPANILLNSAGQVKLCDFSISSILIASRAQTYIGTSDYMAPERIESSQGYTSLSDVWSVGVTAVELLIGQFPYKRSSNIFHLLSQVVHGPTPLEMDKFDWRAFTPECMQFLRACLQKTPMMRTAEVKLLEHPFFSPALHPQREELFLAWLQALPPPTE
eukprot:m.16954 g.16954  ORF g.16954 m.16954 type:complete len:476 (+) comp7003_c0_seq2:906-2333(+)